MKEGEIVTYKALAKIAYDMLWKQMQDDPDFKKLAFCREHNLSYSTFTKFMMLDPLLRKNQKRVWKSFLPKLLKVLEIDVEFSHSIHYYKINKGDSLIEGKV